jgi:hypothetical protein
LKVLLEEFEKSEGAKKMTEQMEAIQALYGDIAKKMQETFQIDITNFDNFVEKLKILILNTK